MVKPTKLNHFLPLMPFMEINMSQVAFCSLTTSVSHVLTIPNTSSTLDTGLLSVSRSTALITLSLQQLQSVTILNGADTMKLWVNNTIKFTSMPKLTQKEYKANQVHTLVFWDQSNTSLLMVRLFMELIKVIQW